MIEITDHVRNVLSRRSVRNKIVVAIDCDLCHVGDLEIISQLVRGNLLVWLDRYTLNHVGIMTANVDVYLLTPAGIAFCDQYGIEQR